MPGADLLFLPLPFAHAARGNGDGPATNGVECHVDPADATAESETVIASAIGAWMDAADVAETWRRLAQARGEALRRIVAAGDAAAKASTFDKDAGLVCIPADVFAEYRRATLAAGLELYPL